MCLSVWHCMKVNTDSAKTGAHKLLIVLSNSVSNILPYIAQHPILSSTKLNPIKPFRQTYHEKDKALKSGQSCLQCMDAYFINSILLGSYFAFSIVISSRTCIGQAAVPIVARRPSRTGWC